MSETDAGSSRQGYEFLVVRSAEGGHAPRNSLISNEEYEQARRLALERLRSQRGSTEVSRRSSERAAQQ